MLLARWPPNWQTKQRDRREESEAVLVCPIPYILALLAPDSRIAQELATLPAPTALEGAGLNFERGRSRTSPASLFHTTY